MHPTPEPTAPLRRNPSRAGTARNSVAHGLRARSLTPVTALGESQPVLDAHLAAYRRELAAPGPYARDLAEAIACAQLRAARAEHLEAQLLARAAEEAGDLAAPGTRAAWALVLRYRREAELSASRARRELEALARARAAGLLPGEDEAAAAEAELDTALVALSRPNEPSLRKTEPEHEVGVAPEPANDDAAPDEPEPADDGAAPSEPEPADDAGAPSEPEPAAPERTAPHLMTALRVFATGAESGLDGFCRGLHPRERATVRLGLALLARRAREAGQPPPPWLAAARRALDAAEAG